MLRAKYLNLSLERLIAIVPQLRTNQALYQGGRTIFMWSKAQSSPQLFFP